jgi:integrase/recombinase XerC
MLTLQTYLRTTRTDRNGLSCLYFIVQKNWISTGIKIPMQYWEQKTCSINKKHPNYLLLNSQYNQLKSKAENCIGNFNFNRTIFDLNYFNACLFGNVDEYQNPCFYSIINKYQLNSGISLARARHYSDLEKDLKIINRHLKLNDITYSFALKLQQFLVKKGNCQNTINSKIIRIKALVHYCQRLGLIDKDPLAIMRLKSVSTTKEHLTQHELLLLEDYYTADTIHPTDKEVLRYFLFSCYTGLRHSDVKNLQHKNISENSITIVQLKTNKILTIPLIEKAKKFIKQFDNSPLKVFTNEFTNRCLKDLMPKAGVHKILTYHSSRHTFATLSLSLGIPYEVVAELLGVDYKTAKVYVKIMDEVKIKEMKKWNNAL